MNINLLQFSPDIGMILGLSIPITEIPPGEGVLLQITFSNYVNDEIFFSIFIKYSSPSYSLRYTPLIDWATA